ncbi:transcription elongation factor GreA [Candidatus Bodocaedibacter vickermanii]|uniref:Transcription elongation factor GreA n=1 Tax=Candidatus Bodocaedibacter vickermanii TaxID=2741701 RepID=A0A7L9RSZ4_9PROT|nr:Transcription elongation factor GreA [Candidatus Paracaedibacteraceae bacterium 'Lake Konstanz']
MEKLPMTREGFEKLQNELKQLKTVDRHEVIKAIASARELGDLSENAEYHAARERQGFIEGRIAELEDKLARADVIDVKLLNGTSVKFGASVKLIDEDTEEAVAYQIVGDDESNLSKGKISLSSPLAKALIGKESGDSVDVRTPGGVKSYEIIEVAFH